MEKIKIVIVYSMLVLIFVLGLAFINRDEYKAIFFRSNIEKGIDNYGITASSDLKDSGSLRESSISDKKYFIDVYEGHFNRVSKCIGRDRSDMISAFYD